MEFVSWLLKNFGVFFGPVFLWFLFLIVRRLTVLYDLLRHVSSSEGATAITIGDDHPALLFLQPFFARLQQVVPAGTKSVDCIIDAIFSEMDCRVSVHFTALNGYRDTLVLIGFAGTIFGSIGAFNVMFQGLAQGIIASKVFVIAWDSGLSTALYTSLGAAAIGGTMVTILYSRMLMTRARRLDAMVNLRIAEILAGDGHGQEKK